MMFKFPQPTATISTVVLAIPTADLSRDNEVSVYLSLPENQTLNEQYYITITDAIRGVFKSKLWRMGKCLSTLGGSKRAPR